MKIEFKIEDKNAILPKPSRVDPKIYEVYSPIDFKLKRFEQKYIKLGFSVKFIHDSDDIENTELLISPCLEFNYKIIAGYDNLKITPGMTFAAAPVLIFMGHPLKDSWSVKRGDKIAHMIVVTTVQTLEDFEMVIIE